VCNRTASGLGSAYEVCVVNQTSERDFNTDGVPSTARLRQPATEEQIVERIFAAVMDRRLRPGVKLPENALCDAFGVARAQVRRILVKLAERGIVTLYPNRGAFVASPSPEEARDIFQTRRTIERSVVENAAMRISREQAHAMHAHVARETAAGAKGDRREAIRLSGQFHIKLAEVAGSPVIARFVEELVARSSLIIAIFGSRQHFSCSEEEHRDLLEAVGRRDGPRAALLMDQHLARLERELDIHDENDEPADIRRILEF
jgi:DNA-binding GntR family transcriptional regulator